MIRLWQRRKLALRYSFFFIYPYLNGHLRLRSRERMCNICIFVFSFVQMQNPKRYTHNTTVVLWSSLSPEKNKMSKIIINKHRETQMSVLAIGIKAENLTLVEFNGRISHSYFWLKKTKWISYNLNRIKLIYSFDRLINFVLCFLIIDDHLEKTKQNKMANKHHDQNINQFSISKFDLKIIRFK